jgi:hypothetical protein
MSGDASASVKLALGRFPGPSEVTQRASADADAINAMDEDEKRVLDTFHSWIGFFSSATKSKPGRRNHKTKGTNKIDVREIALELIDGIGKETVALRRFLEGNT